MNTNLEHFLESAAILMFDNFGDNEINLMGEIAEEIRKKVELADAIIEEALFNEIEIDVIKDELEHQLGTVWVGKASIQPIKMHEENE